MSSRYSVHVYDGHGREIWGLMMREIKHLEWAREYAQTCFERHNVSLVKVYDQVGHVEDIQFGTSTGVILPNEHRLRAKGGLYRNGESVA